MRVSGTGSFIPCLRPSLHRTMLFRALAQQFSGLGQRFAGIGRGQQDPTSGFRRLLSNLSASKLLGSGRSVPMMHIGLGWEAGRFQPRWCAHYCPHVRTAQPVLLPSLVASTPAPPCTPLSRAHEPTPLLLILAFVRRPGAHLFGRKALAAGSTGHMHSIPSTFPIHSSFLTTASAATVLTGMQEMGIWGWLLVDLALNWGGWAVAAVLKVRTSRSYTIQSARVHSNDERGQLALHEQMLSAVITNRCSQTEKFYDLVGSLSFLSLTAGSLALSGVAPRKVCSLHHNPSACALLHPSTT